MVTEREMGENLAEGVAGFVGCFKGFHFWLGILSELAVRARMSV